MTEPNDILSTGPWVTCRYAARQLHKKRMFVRLPTNLSTTIDGIFDIAASEDPQNHQMMWIKLISINRSPDGRIDDIRIMLEQILADKIQMHDTVSDGYEFTLIANDVVVPLKIVK